MYFFTSFNVAQQKQRTLLTLMIIFFGKSTDTVKRGTESVLDAGRELVVEANTEKTKFIC
jgi:hypothetical protein